MREQYVEAFPRRRWFAVTTTGLSATNAVGVPNLDNWARPITPAASTETFYIWNTFRFSVAPKFPYSFNTTQGHTPPLRHFFPLLWRPDIKHI